jgi:hypothetical protein
MTPKECFSYLSPEDREDWRAGKLRLCLIEDSRSGQVTGPFAPAEANRGAESLNDFVFRHSGPSILEGFPKIEGPFYVRLIPDRAALEQIHARCSAAILKAAILEGIRQKEALPRRRRIVGVR